MKYLLLITLFCIMILTFSCSKDHKKPNMHIPPKYAQAAEFKKQGELTFLNAKQKICSIDIEVADNDDNRARGLMYRTKMEQNQGMLFIFEEEEEQAFWMHNTNLPLDIIYVNGNKEIVHIAKNTVPFSVRSIPSEKPAQYVVEVNAGYCDKFGIKDGSRIDFSIKE